MRVARPWPRLPRGAVAAPSLARFKARLDGAGSTLGWGKGSLPMAGGWDEIIFKVTSNPNHSVILCMKCLRDFWAKTACSWLLRTRTEQTFGL